MVDGVLFSSSLILFAAGSDKCPGSGLSTAPGRFISGVVFCNDGREAFDPPAQIICKDEGAASALHGAKLSGLDRPIQFSLTAPGDGASLRDVVGKRCVHLPHHHSAGKIPANTPGQLRATMAKMETSELRVKRTNVTHFQRGNVLALQL
jgi:hypothetical protein